MENGNGKLSLDTILKISQVLVIPLFGVMLWFLLLVGKLDTRLTVLESIALSGPNIASDLAILKDRQDDIRSRIGDLETEFHKHQLFSTYDPESLRGKIKK